MLLSEIAAYLELEFTGEDREITGLNTLADASESEVSFLDNAKYIKQLSETRAAAVLIRPEDASSLPAGTQALISDEPYLKLAYLTKRFAPPVFEQSGEAPSIGEGSVVGEGSYIGFGTTIGKDCTIMPGAYIGDNVTIGDETILYPTAAVYRDCVIGSRVILHASAIIGSDGFGFAHTKTGEHIKIYQNGNVVIEDDVEIGSNTSVDRAAFGSTRIGRNTKIDNHVQIGHNVVVEEGCIFVSHTAVAGSSYIGHHCVFGGQTGVVGHVRIAPFTTVASRGAIASDIKEPGQTWAGFPHMLHKEWLKVKAKTRKLIR